MSTVDQCVVPNTNEHYILVRGYSDATYSIIANGTGVSPPAEDDPNVLVASSGGGGSLGWLAVLSLMFSVGLRARVRG